MSNKDLKLTLTAEDVASIMVLENGNTAPYFAFVSAPHKGCIKSLVSLTYCRETICEYVRQEVRGVRDNGIPMSRLNLVIYRRVAAGRVASNLNLFEEQVMSGQHIVNVIEKHYGWPLTKIYPVSIVNGGVPESCKAYYINASRRWLKSPIMLSLFTLIFRIAARVGKKFEFRSRIKDMDTMFAVLNDAADKSSYQEVSYYRVHGDRWKLILDNYNKLFGSRDISDLYFPGHGNWYFTEGVNKLCDGNSKDHTLNKQFRKIIAKAGA